MTTQSRETTEAIAAALERWEQELIDGYLHERRVELPRRERDALHALERKAERFPGEWKIARDVLSIDIPRIEKFIDTALLILQNADYKSRALFILAAPDKRTLMAAEVQRRGGLVSDTGKWIAL
jgi:hypothetical protein